MTPNYTKIYQDMLQMEHPEKLKDPKIVKLLNNLHNVEDILKLNQKIFKESKESIKNNQKLRNYDKPTVLKILQYQNKHEFSTSYISRKYKISRTTIAKWRKMFEEELKELNPNSK
jgi:response regulator of citrate/malate metabolism